jgi:protein-disulfide isomerase
MRQLIPGGTALAIILTLAACGAGDADVPEARDTSGTTQGLLTQSREGQAARVDVASLGFNMGESESPVRVVEMSDYGCSYCRQFHMETFPTLLADYIETGKVEWKFLPFINGMFENSPAATEAAECALEQGPETFRVLNERLWSDQSVWKQSDEPGPVLRAMAMEAGVDGERFDSCLSSDRRMERIQASTSLAGQLGVRGTPTFFVVGYPPLQGALPLESFTEILDAVYAEAAGGGG